MATKKQDTPIEKAANKAIYVASSANDYLLDTTEQVFDFAFGLKNKSLDITSKILKRGLEISSTQQEFAFELLNGLKRKITK